MKALKAIFWGLLTLVLVLFLFQNRDALLYTTTLELNLFGPLHFRTIPIPLYALVLGSILLGIIATAIYLGIGGYRLRQRLRELQKQNENLQQELNSLRNLPITEPDIGASAEGAVESSQEAAAAKAEEERVGG